MNNLNLRYAVEVVGIIAIVLSLIFVAAELNQSQSAMEAEALSYKNERTAELSMLSYKFGVTDIELKISDGEELSIDEERRIRVFGDALMRHLETIHFEYTQGFVDDEFWDATRTRIRVAANSPFFGYLYPKWGEGPTRGFRASYVELVKTFRSE